MGSEPGKIRPARSWRRREVLAFAAALLIGTLVLRHAIAGALLTRILGALTGDAITLGEYHLGVRGAVFSAVHVTRAGRPLFDAQRITLRYTALAALVGRGPRFGLRAVTLDAPIISIERFADGGYNLGGHGSGTQGSAESAAPRQPWEVSITVRRGELHFIDDAAPAPDLRVQRLRAIECRGYVQSGARSVLVGHAQFVSRQMRGSALRSWPLGVRATVDYPRGVALAHIWARGLPLRGPLSFLVHGPAVRVEDGVLHAFELRIFALGIDPNVPARIAYGGSAELQSGRLAVAALNVPIADIRGRITLVPDGVWSPHLDASIAGMPIVARGGAFNREAPVLRIGLHVDGDLHDLRRVFTFARAQPIAGRAHIETELEAPVAHLLVRTTLHVPHGRYRQLPIDALRGHVDYHAGYVSLDGVTSRYGTTKLDVGGRFLLGKQVDSEVVAFAQASGDRLPYAENLAPDATVHVLALFRGYGTKFRVNGTVGANGATTGTGMFAVDERGVGEFGPFDLHRRDGSSLYGALRLDRPTSDSAAWVSARRYRVVLPPVAVGLPRLAVPAFVPIAGVIDADLAGAGSPSAFALGGEAHGTDIVVAAAALGSASVDLGGTLDDIRLAHLQVRGPTGEFGGSAASKRGVFALRGRYGGSLEALVPFTGPQAAHGAVRGAVLVHIAGPSITVQTPAAQLRNATLRGVAVEQIDGTLAVHDRRLRVISAWGSIRGASAVVADDHGAIDVSAPEVPVAALRALGMPLESGRISAYGRADLRGPAPQFAGVLAVSGGHAQGMTLAGNGRISLRDGAVRVVEGEAEVGSTFGTLHGRVAGFGTSVLHYGLASEVTHGDLDRFRSSLGRRWPAIAGSFAANLRLRGSGLVPSLTGRITVPEGEYHGLAFRDGAATVDLAPGAFAARVGRITVGSTRAIFSGSSSPDGFTLSARAPQVDLADFNGYFDTSGMLSGRGSADVNFAAGAGGLRTSGAVELHGAALRAFPSGDIGLDWRMVGRGIDARGDLHTRAGELAAVAKITPVDSHDSPLLTLQTARVDVQANFSRVDTARWLAAASLELPVAGTAAAHVTVAGRFPALAIGADATLTDGRVGRIPVRSAQVVGTAVGTHLEIRSSIADLGFATLWGRGMIGLGSADPLEFTLRARSREIGTALHTLAPTVPAADLGGVFDTDIRLRGTRGSPQFTGSFELTDARFRGFTVPHAIGQIGLAGNTLEVRDAQVELRSGKALVAGSLPLVLHPFGIGPSTARLGLDLTAQRVDLSQFTDLLPGTTLGGSLDGRFGVEGTVGQPRFVGSLALRDGSYVGPFERTPVDGVSATLDFGGNSIALQALHAVAGRGTLDGSARFTLPRRGAADAAFRAQLRAHAATLDFPAFGHGTVDGELTFTGAGLRSDLSGSVALRNAVIPVSAIYGLGNGAATAGAGGLGLNPTLHVNASADTNVRVRSAIVDIGVIGGVDVSGSLVAPRLQGGFLATDGTISSYNHVFRVLNAAVTFDPANGATPTIRARAVSHVSDPDPDPSRNISGAADIFVTVNGSSDAQTLQLTYSSEPAYSQEQIIGLLLDFPALLGAVNFDLNDAPGAPLLRGAPSETNALLPPGITPEQVSAISLNEEVFSLLNGQLTQHALEPIERIFQHGLGLSDVEFTVDYGGGLGYSLRRQLGKPDFSAFLSQTVTYPQRVNLGVQLAPRAYQQFNFSIYAQNGVTSLITNQTPGELIFTPGKRYTSVQPLGNRAGLSANFTRRF